MKGLQPFYRGLYRLASRGSRTAAAVGSRVEFCGTQTSAKVRSDRPVCVSLPTRRHLSCLQVRCVQQLCPTRMLWHGRKKRSDTGRSGTENAVFPAQKKAQKNTSVKAQTQLELMPGGYSFSSRVSGRQWMAGACMLGMKTTATKGQHCL